MTIVACFQEKNTKYLISDSRVTEGEHYGKFTKIFKIDKDIYCAITGDVNTCILITGALKALHKKNSLNNKEYIVTNFKKDYLELFNQAGLVSSRILEFSVIVAAPNVSFLIADAENLEGEKMISHSLIFKDEFYGSAWKEVYASYVTLMPLTEWSKKDMIIRAIQTVAKFNLTIDDKIQCRKIDL